MSSKHILTFLGLNISFLSLLFWVVLPATSQESSIGGVPNTVEDDLTISSGDFIESPLTGTQVSTKTIEAHIPFKEYRYHYAAEVTGMPGGTYTWHLEDFPADTLSDVFYDWRGGSGCSQQANNNIVCGSGIDYFYVEFRFSSTYSPASNFISIAAGGFSQGFSPDHTITLNYLQPLTFITSTRYSSTTPIAPFLHSNTTLKWRVSNTTNGSIVATFHDPRISVVHLPMLNK